MAAQSRAAHRIAVVGALAVVAVSVTRFTPPTYALESFYTNHLQHEYSAWAFLHIGPRIFALPKTEWGDVHALHVHLLWDTLPTIYPPGLVLFFMPFAVASNEGLVSDLHVHMLEVITLSMAGVLASFQLRRTLRLSHEPVLAAILTFFGAILFVQWGLEGFIDSLAAGLALTAEQAVALAAGLVVVGITYFSDRPAAAACVALALALIFFVDQWEPWYPVVLFPLLTIVRTRRAQIAVTLACLQTVAYLGGFPNVLHTAQVYIDAVR